MPDMGERGSLLGLSARSAFRHAGLHGLERFPDRRRCSARSEKFSRSEPKSGTSCIAAILGKHQGSVGAWEALANGITVLPRPYRPAYLHIEIIGFFEIPHPQI
jgi:hypothetical protein